MAEEVEAPDLSFLPEQFKGEDGAYDTKGFTEHYDSLATFKSQADESAAAIPTEVSGYTFDISEGHAYPEGFDAKLFPQAVLDAEGKPVIENGAPKTRDLEPSDLLDQSDPDLPLLQAAMLKHGAKPEIMQDIASIMTNRELRNLMQATETKTTELKALGPDATSRVAQLERTLNTKLPPAQAKAINDSITSADALRGIEAILKASTAPPAAVPDKGFDSSTASIDERIAEGLRRREA